MNEIVVIYKSKYGSTQKYAEWIASELNADIFDASKTSANSLKNYSTIIYGGGLYASGILGISLITKSFNELKDKNLIVYTVGLADPQNFEQFKPVINKNFTPEMQKAIKIFNFRGTINYKKLNIIHKIMMAMLKYKISKMNKCEMSKETKTMLETYGQLVDFTDKKSIKPLIYYCKKLYS